MASKPRSTDVVFSLDFTLTQERFAYLAEMAQAKDTPLRKAQSAILGLVEQASAGGLMLTADELERIKQSTGVDPSCGEDLLPFLVEGTGREEGKLVVKFLVDPAYITPLEEIAKVRGGSVEDIVRETLEVCFDNGWYEQLPMEHLPLRVTPGDREKLEQLLGGTFATGSDLVKLIEMQIGGGNLFDDMPTSEAPLPAIAADLTSDGGASV